MQWSLQLSSDLAFVFDALCASDSAVQLLVPVRVYVQYEYVYEEYGKEEGDKEKEKTRKMESGWDQRSKQAQKGWRQIHKSVGWGCRGLTLMLER